MWRQTGPIIISMSYMILDVAVFLFIFVIVYISFTLRYVKFRYLHSLIKPIIQISYKINALKAWLERILSSLAAFLRAMTYS